MKGYLSTYHRELRLGNLSKCVSKLLTIFLARVPGSNKPVELYKLPFPVYCKIATTSLKGHISRSIPNYGDSNDFTIVAAYQYLLCHEQ